MSEAWIQKLQEYITPERQQRYREILAQRTRYLTVVLEDFYQSHNMSACLRSCECFGIQDIHIIENINRFEIIKDISLGSGQWLNVHRYNALESNTLDCFQHLREQGYRILGTAPDESSIPLDELDLDQKTALVFGTEYTGLSAVAQEEVDGTVYIPMVGFTESMNVSVAVATCIHLLSWKLRQSERPWQLTEQEQQELLIEWMRLQVRKHWKGLDERIIRDLQEQSAEEE